MKTTKGAQSAPIPFSELQSAALKGPYFTDETFRHVYGKSGVIFDVRGNGKPEQSTADVEVVIRLLNFAQAGGPEAMARLIDACGWVQSCGGADVKVDMAKARDALAILNGEESNP